MPKTKYPPILSEWLRKQGVKLKLAELLEVADRVLPVFVINPEWVYPAVKLEVVTSAAAGSQTIDLRPAAGKRWLIILAMGYHDDTSSRSGHWQVYDGVNTMARKNISLAASIMCSPYLDTDVSTGLTMDMPFPFILTRDVYLQWTVASLGTGKKCYIKALVMEVNE